MKRYPKMVLLVVFALLLALTACQRPASRAPIASPTPSGEAPFPYETPDQIAVIRTQTAIALNPAGQPTNTPETQQTTPAAPEQTGGDTSEAAPEAAPETAATTDTQAGGGVEEVVEIPDIVRPETYTLQHGEFPYCIARRFDVDISSLLALNGLNLNSQVATGAVLRIPGTGNWNPNHGSRSLRSHPETITVGGGDTIYTIACRYGDVSPEQILAANKLSNASEIRAGMSLKIP